MNANTEECNICKGKGYFPVTIIVESIGNPKDTEVEVLTEDGPKTYPNILCPKCKGTGKIDWVSRVTNHQSSVVPNIDELAPELFEMIKDDKVFNAQEVLWEHQRKEFLKNFAFENKDKWGV